MMQVVKQFYVNVEKDEWKFDTLCDLYGMSDIHKAMIFCNSKESAELLANKLTGKNFTVSVLYRGMPQNERDLIKKDFGSGSVRVLVVSGLFARQKGFQDVSLVINYDIPKTSQKDFHMYVVY